MTPQQERALRGAATQIAQVQQDILLAALSGSLSPGDQADMVQALRAVADKLERLDD